MINKDNIIYIFLGLFLLDMITTSIGMSLGLMELNPAYNTHFKNVLIHSLIGSIFYFKNDKLKKIKYYNFLMGMLCGWYLVIFCNNIFHIISLLF